MSLALLTDHAIDIKSAFLSVDVPIPCAVLRNTLLLRSYRAEVMARRWTGGLLGY